MTMMGLREAFQAIDDGDEDVDHAAPLDFGHAAHPELGSLGLLNPKSQSLLGIMAGDADRHVNRFVADQTLTTSLHPLCNWCLGFSLTISFE
jgi:hypothetical protein